jgi:hypothetical protein
MKDWVKIQTFDRIHQAELRKDILEKNDIPSVIINEKDSLFLIGEIELYVRQFDEAKARELIDEFNGLAKINSFVGDKQMKLHRDILLENSVNAFLKRKEDSKFVLDNYELYVRNEDIEKAIPFLKEENLKGYKKIATCESVSQTKYRTDILDEKNIDNFIIKRKDSNLHLEKVEIYVKEEDSVRSIELLSSLNGWICIRDYDSLTYAEIDEDVLNLIYIKAIITKFDEKVYKIFVEAHNEELAIDKLNTSREWVILNIYQSIENAMTIKRILDKNNIHSVIINEKDSSFLLGDIELYVEIDKKEKAENIIKDWVEK